LRGRFPPDVKRAWGAFFFGCALLVEPGFSFGAIADGGAFVQAQKNRPKAVFSFADSAPVTNGRWPGPSVRLP